LIIGATSLTPIGKSAIGVLGDTLLRKICYTLTTPLETTKPEPTCITPFEVFVALVVA